MQTEIDSIVVAAAAAAVAAAAVAAAAVAAAGTGLVQSVDDCLAAVGTDACRVAAGPVAAAGTVVAVREGSDGGPTVATCEGQNQCGDLSESGQLQ